MNLRKPQIFTFAALLVLLMSFQNCSRVRFSKSQAGYQETDESVHNK